MTVSDETIGDDRLCVHECGRVAAVVVTFNPNVEQLGSVLKAIAPQVDKTYVVDNGSSVSVATTVTEMASVQLMSLKENIGIGAAQNLGSAAANEDDARFIIFFDQDSMPDSDLVAQCLHTWQLLSGQGMPVGAVGALPILRESQGAFIRFGWFRHEHVAPQEGQDWVACDVLISSGTMVSAEVLAAVGPFDESLFIDKVDTEWCIRAASRGFFLAGAPRARLQHSLGERSVRVWRGSWRNLPEHKPFRYYYMLRNASLLLRRSYVPWRARTAIFTDSVQVFALFSIFPSTRKLNFQMMLKGMWDGIRKRSGPMAHATRAVQD